MPRPVYNNHKYIRRYIMLFVTKRRSGAQSGLLSAKATQGRFYQAGNRRRMCKR